EKGLQTILPLFRQRPQCALEIVGDGPFRAELERMAAGSPNIRFLGSVSAREVRALLPNTRALIVPSLFPETFGYVLIEAWSQGVPTLASCSGALPEVSSAGGGLTCASTQDFAEWIDRLHAEPHVARERGLEGWTQTRHRFSEAAHVHAWESLVTECQDRGEPRSGIDADATAGPSTPHERTP
ncbi:MAG: glycosyltransferase family 4 protein, partial [Candidatus Limnocylindrus sp.]